MIKSFLRWTVALVMAVGLAVMAPGQAQAAPNAAKCRIVKSNTVGGMNWTRLKVKRVCTDKLKSGTSGTAYLAKRSIQVNFNNQRTTTKQVEKATVHELAHHVEFRTSNAQRAKLYKHLGLKNPKGNYFAINDRYYYNGSMARWKQSPRERLAESVVNCTYGTPNHKGMKLVPKNKCKVFMKDFKQSLAVAR
ncbi:hypothetical protein ACTQ49_12080 [Luteococcus sp. Sow4_B9]|uniref:hypothetical protein n=1 Tax=Luteococcus sp. Sow4_B9 TaxID=3438792 RepID=UPI003F96B6F7